MRSESIKNGTHTVLPAVELGPTEKLAIPNAFVEERISVVAHRNFHGFSRTDAMVLAQPNHDRDCGHKKEALTKLCRESDGIGDAGVATLIGA